MSFPETIKNPHGEALDFQIHEASRSDYLVVIAHGVTANKDRELLVKIAEGLSEKGWPCLRFSFSGNGDSEGDFEAATITKEADDLRAVLDAVLDAVSDGKKIVYVGHSMGGAVGAKVAAADSRISVMVSLAGMVEAGNFYQREFGDLKPGSDCMWEEESCPLSVEFAEDMKLIVTVIPQVKAVKVPWLFLHGTEDDVVPFSDSELAYEAVTSRKKLVGLDGAGHMFSEEYFEGMVREIDYWIASV